MTKAQLAHRKPKIRVGVVFGGRSVEHQVSLVSAMSVIRALDKSKYEVIPIGITPEGKWLSSPDAVAILKSSSRSNSMPEELLLPNPGYKGLICLDSKSQIANQRRGWTRLRSSKPLDVLFPVLHGAFGEDGTVQGLFELAAIPYVGAGVLGSAAGMDKIVTKQLCQKAGIPVTPYVWFLRKEFARRPARVVTTIERSFRYPCFVKPANSGSSVGISKAHDRKELLAAIELASAYDRKILVEKGIENAREIEVSVLGNDDPEASVPGEIVSSNEFYDYDAKYVDGKSEAMIPAKLPRAVRKQLQSHAIRTFTAIDSAGMARVDFLVGRRTNRIYMNEINTIPGFTSISMYPKLWEASGLPYSKLLDRLIELAIERHRERKSFKTVFTPKERWYK